MKRQHTEVAVGILMRADGALLLSTRICVMGQAPSKIIYDVKIPADRRPTRETLFDDVEMMKLRNELIRYINRDVASHIE